MIRALSLTALLAMPGCAVPVPMVTAVAGAAAAWARVDLAALDAIEAAEGRKAVPVHPAVSP